MTNEEYNYTVLKTEATDITKIANRLKNEDIIRLLHSGIGIATEMGEFLDTLKKHIFYGKDLDTINLIEDLGDLYWYMNVAQDVLNITTEEIQKTNIRKLQIRYNSTFTKDKAINRDLKTERESLEKVKESLKTIKKTLK